MSNLLRRARVHCQWKFLFLSQWDAQVKEYAFGGPLKEPLNQTLDDIPDRVVVDTPPVSYNF